MNAKKSFNFLFLFLFSIFLIGIVSAVSYSAPANNTAHLVIDDYHNTGDGVVYHRCINLACSSGEYPNTFSGVSLVYNDNYDNENEVYSFFELDFNLSSVNLTGQYISDVKIYLKLGVSGAWSSDYPSSIYVKNMGLNSVSKLSSESNQSHAQSVLSSPNYITLNGASFYSAGYDYIFRSASLSNNVISDITSKINAGNKLFSLAFVGIADEYDYESGGFVNYFDISTAYIQVITSDIPLYPPTLDINLTDIYLGSYENSSSYSLTNYFSGYYSSESSLYNQRFSYSYNGGSYFGYVGVSEKSTILAGGDEPIFDIYIGDGGLLEISSYQISGDYDLEICAYSAGGSTCDTLTLHINTLFTAYEKIILAYNEVYTFDWYEHFEMMGEDLDEFSFDYFWIKDNSNCIGWTSAYTLLTYPLNETGLKDTCGWGYDWSSPQNTIKIIAGNFNSDMTVKVYGCEEDLENPGNYFCAVKIIDFLIRSGGVEIPPIPPFGPGDYVEEITNSWGGLFPDADDLTTKQKVSYIIIFAFLLAVILLVGSFFIFKSILPGIMYLVLILEFLLFVYFVSIQYISLFVLIVFLTVLVAVIFLLKGRGG